MVFKILVVCHCNKSNVTQISDTALVGAAAQTPEKGRDSLVSGQRLKNPETHGQKITVP